MRVSTLPSGSSIHCNHEFREHVFPSGWHAMLEDQPEPGCALGQEFVPPHQCPAYDNVARQRATLPHTCCSLGIHQEAVWLL